VDTVYRCFTLTARQAMQIPGWEEKLPRGIKSAAASRGNDMFEFVHCVKPNGDYRQGRAGPEGMQFQSRYVAREGSVLLQDGGYRVQPYAVGRYVTGPREIYGRSPAMEALADIKSLQEIRRSSCLRRGPSMPSRCAPMPSTTATSVRMVRRWCSR
jgi:hypothetical protein